MTPGAPACPLCGWDETIRGEELAVAEIIAAWRRRQDIDVAAEFADIDALERRSCPRCRLEFYAPPCPGSARLYEQLAKLPWYYMADKWEHGRALRDLAGCRRVLEVGAGDGAFVARLAAAGIEAVGLELNVSAVQEARAAGLDLRSVTLAKFSAADPAPFDAVCAFQVLEHAARPDVFLRSCLERLAPGGRLVLAVPDGAGFLRHAGNLTELPPHHVTAWSAECLACLPRLFPLHLERLVREPLAAHHVDLRIAAHANRTRSFERPGSVWRRLRIRALKRLLRPALIRRFVAGHTLYACYRKIT